jgi:hypothetical protein
VPQTFAKIVGKMERGSVKYGKIGKIFFSVFVKHLLHAAVSVGFYQ